MAERIFRRQWWRGGLLAVAAALLNGCSSAGYYAQSIRGHLDLMGRATPIDELLEEPTTDEALSRKLKRATAIRDFASRELLLPENDSYRSYADLERDQVVWTVVATGHYSVAPHPSCFLVVGCLNYRGYFAREDAEAYGGELRARGMDVAIGRSTAYSTLGWFDDPLLNTMLNRGEAKLVEVIFHELAHQRLYLKGDSTFNESFATAVAQIGAERWFASQGAEEEYRDYLASAARREAFNRLLISARHRLAELYRTPIDEEAMARGKAEEFARLAQEYRELKASWGGYDGYDRWMGQRLNNAHLALVSTYNDYVADFIALYRSHGEDMARFYQAVEVIGALPEGERGTALAQATKG